MAWHAPLLWPLFADWMRAGCVSCPDSPRLVRRTLLLPVRGVQILRSGSPATSPTPTARRLRGLASVPSCASFSRSGPSRNMNTWTRSPPSRSRCPYPARSSATSPQPYRLFRSALQPRPCGTPTQPSPSAHPRSSAWPRNAPVRGPRSKDDLTLDIELPKKLIDAPLVPGVDEVADDLNLLLRHRPRSISQRGRQSRWSRTASPRTKLEPAGGWAAQVIPESNTFSEGGPGSEISMPCTSFICSRNQLLNGSSDDPNSPSATNRVVRLDVHHRDGSLRRLLVPDDLPRDPGPSRRLLILVPPHPAHLAQRVAVEVLLGPEQPVSQRQAQPWTLLSSVATPGVSISDTGGGGRRMAGRQRSTLTSSMS